MVKDSRIEISAVATRRRAVSLFEALDRFVLFSAPAWSAFLAALGFPRRRHQEEAPPKAHGKNAPENARYACGVRGDVLGHERVVSVRNKKPAWFASTAKAKTDTRPYTNAVLRLDSTGCVSMYAAPIAVARNVFASIRFEVVAHATKFAPSLPALAGALNQFTQTVLVADAPAEDVVVAQAARVEVATVHEPNERS